MLQQKMTLKYKKEKGKMQIIYLCSCVSNIFLTKTFRHLNV